MKARRRQRVEEGIWNRTSGEEELVKDRCGGEQEGGRKGGMGQ